MLEMYLLSEKTDPWGGMAVSGETRVENVCFGLSGLYPRREALLNLATGLSYLSHLKNWMLAVLCWRQDN